MGQPGARKLDQITSVTPGDIHIIIPPTGPPVPVPHPVPNSIIKDKVANKVKVMGQPGAVKGSISKHSPPHFPMGPYTFQKPPANKGEIFTASSNVLYEGKAAAMLGDTAKMCADPTDAPVGMVIGKAATVEIGGGGSGSDEARAAAADAAMKAAQAHCKHLMDNPMTGHPIDVIGGTLVITNEDVVLDGPLPIQFVRTYVSSSADRKGPLGSGWFHNYQESVERVTRENPLWEDVHAEFTGRGNPSPTGIYLIYRDSYGVETRLHEMKDGMACFVPALKKNIGHYGEMYSVTSSPYAQHHFVSTLSNRSSYTLSQIVDRHGNKLTFKYDEDNRLVSIKDVYGRMLILTYGQKGFIASLTVRADGVDHLWSCFEYGHEGELVTIIDRGEGITRFTYDSHAIVREQSADNYSFFFEYDDKRRCVHTWGQDGYLTRYLQYDPTRGRTWVINGEGETTLYQYDEANRTSRVEQTNGLFTEFVYDEKGRLVGRRNGTGSEGEITYDELGFLKEFADGDGVTATFTYDSVGRCIGLTDGAGGENVAEFDDTYNPILRTIPGLGEARLDYDRMGRVVKARRSTGTLHYEYDRFGHVSLITDEHNQPIHYKYDALGRLLELRMFGHVSVFQWDKLGRMVRHLEDGQLVVEQAFNFGGQLLWERDGNGREQRRIYTGLQVVELSRWYHPDDTMRQVERYSYDREGRLVKVSDDAGELVSLTHNEAGQLIVEHYSNGWRRFREYDGAGRMALLADSTGAWKQYQYSGAGRVTKISCSGNLEHFYEYDEGGRLIEAGSGDTTVSFQLDPLGRILGESQNEWGFSATFNEMGRQTLQIQGFDQLVEFDYDETGRLNAVTYGPWKERRKFSVEGLLKERAAANGVIHKYQYDSNWRLSTTILSRLSGQELYRRRLEYHPVGWVASISDTLRGMRRMRYDPMSNLVGVVNNSESDNVEAETYQFDRRGDLVQSYLGAVSKMSPQEGFRTQTVRNPKGVIVSLHYDGLGCLSDVLGEGDESWRYTYDALGRRLRKVYLKGRATVSETDYLWDGNVLLAERTKEGEKLLQSLYISIGMSVQMRIDRVDGAETILVYHNDQLGTPDVCTNSSGEIVWYRMTDVFGVQHGPSQNVSQNVGFPGQYWDDESGLYYNRYRHYDPKRARYVQPDPLASMIGWNPYSYPSDPISFVDPLGLASQYRVPRQQASQYISISNDPALEGMRPVRAPMTLEGEAKVFRKSHTDIVAGASGHERLAERLDTRPLTGFSRLVIDSHGTPGQIEHMGETIDGRELARRLHANGFTGNQVVLVVCHAANQGPEGSSMAQDLADELYIQTGNYVEVIAATGKVYAGDGGGATLVTGMKDANRQFIEGMDESGGATTFSSFSASRPPEELLPGETSRPH